jgi:hypothetical protein
MTEKIPKDEWLERRKNAQNVTESFQFAYHMLETFCLDIKARGGKVSLTYPDLIGDQPVEITLAINFEKQGTED